MGEPANGEEAVAYLKSIDYATATLTGRVDMVMKGGITSGVVYPLAVCELARERRFKNLGGSSAGGIAAAFAAVAEHNRAGNGFHQLADVPLELGEVLLKIFQPSPRTRPLFNILLAGLDKDAGPLARIGKIVGAIVASVRLYFWATVAVVLFLALLAAMAVAGVPHGGGDWARLLRALPFALVPALALGLVGALVGLAVTGRSRLQGNGYGLCIGSNGPGAHQVPAGQVKPFTDWMHDKINQIGGLAGQADSVITFADLWGPDGKAKPAIRLEMMTTNVTLCRPLRLPFETTDYWFCEDELRPYFPPEVLARMTPAGVERRACPACGPDKLVPMPAGGGLPVIVAVRMTLSFPGLISAVPLYYIDDKTPEALKCWFSDGGISSNFPIHFFDSLWPGHPTFGISLGPKPAGGDGADVFLPAGDERPSPRPRGTAALTGFLTAMLDTLQNWSDEGQSALRGYRERIVEVRLSEEEGGMNLNMPRERILDLSYRGWKAARAFAGFDFDKHQQTRYGIAMAQLQRAVANMCEKYDPAADGAPSGPNGYRQIIAALGPDCVSRTDRLLRFVGRPEGDTGTPLESLLPDFTAGEEQPPPDLRIVAHF